MHRVLIALACFAVLSCGERSAPPQGDQTAPGGDGTTKKRRAARDSRTEDGFNQRTSPTTKWTCTRTTALPVPGGRLVLLGDVFNLFNTHTVTDYDDSTESTFGMLNPDFGRRIAFQNPMAVRFGVRWEF